MDSLDLTPDNPEEEKKKPLEEESKEIESEDTVNIEDDKPGIDELAQTFNDSSDGTDTKDELNGDSISLDDDIDDIELPSIDANTESEIIKSSGNENDISLSGPPISLDSDDDDDNISLDSIAETVSASLGGSDQTEQKEEAINLDLEDEEDSPIEPAPIDDIKDNAVTEEIITADSGAGDNKAEDPIGIDLDSISFDGKEQAEKEDPISLPEDAQAPVSLEDSKQEAPGESANIAGISETSEKTAEENTVDMSMLSDLSDDSSGGSAADEKVDLEQDILGEGAAAEEKIGIDDPIMQEEVAGKEIDIPEAAISSEAPADIPSDIPSGDIPENIEEDIPIPNIPGGIDKADKAGEKEKPKKKKSIVLPLLMLIIILGGGYYYFNMTGLKKTKPVPMAKRPRKPGTKAVSQQPKNKINPYVLSDAKNPQKDDNEGIMTYTFESKIKLNAAVNFYKSKLVSMGYKIKSESKEGEALSHLIFAKSGKLCSVVIKQAPDNIGVIVSYVK